MHGTSHTARPVDFPDIAPCIRKRLIGAGMSDKRHIVAITGASGFIGRRLVAEHVRRGDRIRVLTRRADVDFPAGVETCIGDLAGETLPPGFPGEADVLYHCAAELSDPTRMRAVNVDGAQRLADAAAGRIGRWVQLSSVGVYGSRADGEITEDTPLRPTNDYEVTKAAGDNSVLDAAARGSFACTLLRPSIVFGPGMPNSALFQLAGAIRRGLFFYVGPQGAIVNYVFVDNVIDALLLCGSHPAAAGRIYNLSDWLPMESFVETIAATLGVPRPRLRLPLAPVRAIAAVAGLFPGSPLTVARVDALSRRSRYPVRRIESELGYHHRVSIADGLRVTLAPLMSEKWQS